MQTTTADENGGNAVPWRRREAEAVRRVLGALDGLSGAAAVRVVRRALGRHAEEALADVRFVLTDHPLRPRRAGDPGAVRFTTANNDPKPAA